MYLRRVPAFEANKRLIYLKNQVERAGAVCGMEVGMLASAPVWKRKSQPEGWLLQEPNSRACYLARPSTKSTSLSISASETRGE